MLYLRWSRQLPFFSSYWIPDSPSFPFLLASCSRPLHLLLLLHLAGRTSFLLCRRRSCSLLVGRATFKSRRSSRGRRLLNDANHLPRWRGTRAAAATQRTRLVHTYGRDRLPLFFPLGEVSRVLGLRVYRYLESNEDEHTQNHASFLASRTFEILSSTSDTSTRSLFLFYCSSCFDSFTPVREIARRSWKLE